MDAWSQDAALAQSLEKRISREALASGAGIEDLKAWCESGAAIAGKPESYLAIRDLIYRAAVK